MLWVLLFIVVLLLLLERAQSQKAAVSGYSRIQVSLEQEQQGLLLTIQPKRKDSSLQFAPVAVWLKQDSDGEWYLEDTKHTS